MSVRKQSYSNRLVELKDREDMYLKHIEALKSAKSTLDTSQPPFPKRLGYAQKKNKEFRENVIQNMNKHDQMVKSARRKNNQSKIEEFSTRQLTMKREKKAQYLETPDIFSIPTPIGKRPISENRTIVKVEPQKDDTVNISSDENNILILKQIEGNKISQTISDDTEKSDQTQINKDKTKNISSPDENSNIKKEQNENLPKIKEQNPINDINNSHNKDTVDEKISPEINIIEEQNQTSNEINYSENFEEIQIVDSLSEQIIPLNIHLPHNLLKEKFELLADQNDEEINDEPMVDQNDEEINDEPMVDQNDDEFRI